MKAGIKNRIPGNIHKQMTSIVVVLLLLSSTICSGQIEFSSGIDMIYPVLLNSNNSKLNYSQIGFGFGVGVAYKPAETQFFPILKLSGGRTKLPLLDVGRNVATLNFNYMNLMLNENLILRFPNSEVFVYGGIGLTHLAQKGLKMSGPGGETFRAVIDSTKNISQTFPAMNIGFEYNYGESAGKDLYITIGLNIQYVMLLSDRNTYSISITKPGAQKESSSVDLSGNLFTPGFYLAVHYMLRLHKK